MGAQEWQHKLIKGWGAGMEGGEDWKGLMLLLQQSQAQAVWSRARSQVITQGGSRVLAALCLGERTWRC